MVSLIGQVGIGLGIGAIATAADFAGPLLIQPKLRNINGIVADATLSEVGIDNTTITEHPVEQGAPITDHAYQMPAQVIIQAGFSNSGLAGALNFGIDYASHIYDQFLQMQRTRTVFTVVTGKRRYDNMLIASLQQFTDVRSENALNITIVCQQIITVSTTTVTIPPATQSNLPATTQPPQAMGLSNPFEDAGGLPFQ